MISPSPTGYTIYTIENCVYCVRAKQLLKDAYVVNILPSEMENFLDFIRPYIAEDYRTFPMIFADGIFIGGFTDARIHYDQHNKVYDCKDENF
jgi:glutaredoxin